MAAMAPPASPATATPEPILDIRGLSVTFRTADGPVEAVRDYDLEVRPGETLAIVGESGSGISQSGKTGEGGNAASANLACSSTHCGRP